ncbi:MAG: Na/Pi cotransporter family protein [Firmicutes bacterium]|nr:Na/Pi cotransporter family protein [Bacillota bacterium]
MDVLVAALGLGLFFGGLWLLRRALSGLFAAHLTTRLQAQQGRPAVTLAMGIGAGALLQSSSTVSVIGMSLLNLRLLSLRNAITLLLGANVGGSLTVEVLTATPAAMSWALCTLGLTGLVALPQQWKLSGFALLGLGLSVAGVDQVGTAMLPIISGAFLSNALHASTLWSSFGIGVMAGALLQSASAATSLLMAPLISGHLSFSQTIAIVAGANLGSCLPAILAGASGNEKDRAVALAQVLINLLGVLVILPLAQPLGKWLEAASIPDPHALTVIQLLVNTAAAITAFPVVGPLARLVEAIAKRQAPPAAR